ncbi:MAG TPA: hypothetical protein VGE02_01615 [Gemmatimonadales bacterium]
MRILVPALLATLLSPLAPAPAAAQETIGSFAVVPNRDPITDADRGVVGTVALDPGDRAALLVWKCMEDGLNVIYQWDRYFGGDEDDDVALVWRFDSEPAWERQWAQLLDQEQNSAWIRMHQVTPFTGAALAARKVAVRVTDPLDGETITDQFELDGLLPALRQLSCAGDLLRSLGGR